jgi:fucose 4-O-acetylase-like acetyltransferase
VDSSSQRLIYFDVARGIGILCVILGHMPFYHPNRFVLTFHIPIFFLVSGYFLNRRIDFKSFTKKRAKQLLLPYIFTCGCIIIGSSFVKGFGLLGSFSDLVPNSLDWFYASLYGSGYRSDFFSLNILPIGAIWFLLACFFSLVIVKFFSRYKYPWIPIMMIVLIDRADYGKKSLCDVVYQNPPRVNITFWRLYFL